MFTNASLKLRMLVNIVPIVYNERKNEKRKFKGQNMTALMYGGGESLLYVKERA